MQNVEGQSGHMGKLHYIDIIVVTGVSTPVGCFTRPPRCDSISPMYRGAVTNELAPLVDEANILDVGITRWASNPYIRGAWSYARVNSSVKEHTWNDDRSAGWPRYIHGCLIDSKWPYFSDFLRGFEQIRMKERYQLRLLAPCSWICSLTGPDPMRRSARTSTQLRRVSGTDSCLQEKVLADFSTATQLPLYVLYCAIHAIYIHK